MHVSVIIPAFNEEKRIGKTLSDVFDFFTQKQITFEVIVIDDGSSDQTTKIAQESGLARAGKLKVVHNVTNKGKGYSVKTGISLSKGEFVLFTDADLSCPIEEFSRLYNYCMQGYDIVIASRGLGDSLIKVRQPWYRERMGKIFNGLVRMLLNADFKDTQCGFKLFKGIVARDIASMVKLDGFCFDVELLYLALRKKYSIKEVGVTWINSPQSKVRLLGSSFSMFWDLFRIRSLHSCNS